MTELQSLLARVEAAEGPDRELDAKLVVAFDIRTGWAASAGGRLWIDTRSLDEPVVRIHTVGRKSVGDPPLGDYAKYTASIDAALALVEKVLPGASIFLEVLYDHSAVCRLLYGDDCDAASGNEASAPLAVLAALLKAKIAEGA